MVSKKEILQNVKELTKKVEEFIPTQTVQNTAVMKAKEAVIDAQVGKAGIYNNTGVYYNDWLIINQWANYMANVFKYETKDLDITLFINRSIRYAFIFGYVYVWNNKGKPEIVYPERVEGKLKVAIINEDLDNSIKGADWYKMQGQYARYEADEADIILYKFESLGFSAFITLGPIIKFEKLASKSLYNEALMLPTRLVNSSENPDPNGTAAKQVTDFNGPIMFKYADGTDKFEGLEIAYASNQLVQVLEYTKNWYADIIGRRSNTDFKRAHSLNAEIEAGQDNFKILERDRYLHLKRYLKQFKKLFKLDKLLLETTIGEYKDVDEYDVIKEEKDVIIGDNNRTMKSGVN